MGRESVDKAHYQQALALVPYFADHEVVRRKLRSRHPDKDELARAILDALSVPDIASSSLYLKHLYCYCPNDSNKARIYLRELVTEQHDGKMLLFRAEHTERIDGRKEKSQFAVKWYTHDGDIGSKEEASIYHKIYKNELPPDCTKFGLPRRCKLPGFAPDYYLWGQPVLVLEWLEPLKLGKVHEKDIIKPIVEQLAHLHYFVGVHCDLKPANIMMSEEGPTLIDFGGVATERHKDGYYRWTRTRKWTSQRKGEHLVYPKHDLLELCYTARTIQSARRHEKKKDPRHGFHGRLKEFYDLVESMDDYPSWKDYKALIDIYRRH